MTDESRERTSWLRRSRSVVVVGWIAVVAGLALLLVLSLRTGPEHDPGSAGGTDLPAFQSGPSPSATTSVELPPGMDSGGGSSTAPSTSSAGSPTPQVVSLINDLSYITDPREFATKYGIIFSSFAFTGSDGLRDWEANANSGATTQGQGLIERTAGDVWQGALMARLNVEPSGAPSVRELWMYEGASMWRVDVPVQMRSADPSNKALDGPAHITWDFYLEEQSDSTWRLSSYAKPARINESPTTYSPAR